MEKHTLLIYFSKAGKAILISDKLDFRTKKIKDRDGHYIKGLIHQEYIAILNIYASNNRAAKYTKQQVIKLKGEVGKSTFTLEISTLLSQQLTKQPEK